MSVRVHPLAVLAVLAVIRTFGVADLQASSALEVFSSQSAAGSQGAEAPKKPCADAEQCSGKGCFDIANSRAIKEMFQGVKADPTCQAALYVKACEGGYASACSNAGSKYMHGDGVPKDGARGLELWDRGCNSGESSDCLQLAVTYYKGEDVKKDAQAGARYWDAACKIGDASACFRLGTLHLIGGLQPPARASEFYQKACDLKNGLACRLVAPRAPAASAQRGASDVLARLTGKWDVSVSMRGGILEGGSSGLLSLV